MYNNADEGMAMHQLTIVFLRHVWYVKIHCDRVPMGMQFIGEVFFYEVIASLRVAENILCRY